MSSSHTLIKKRGRLARRVRGVRARIARESLRARLVVYRSERHIYAQVIDTTGKVVASSSTLDGDVAGAVDKKTYNVAAATAVGKSIAAKSAAAGVTEVVFDRGGRPYHGRVKALADAAREGGLKF